MKTITKKEIFDIIRNENIDTAAEIIYEKIARLQKIVSRERNIATENGKRMGEKINELSKQAWATK